MVKSGFKYRLNYHTLLILAFVIPLYKEFSAPIIALLFIFSIINHRPWNQLLKEWKILVPMLLFAITTMSLLYTIDQSEGMSKIETKLSWLLFPIIFWLADLPYKKIIPMVFLSFVEGCLIAGLVSIFNASVLFYFTQDISHFFYGNFGYFHHTSYAGMYYSLALLIIYYYALKPSKKFHLTAPINFFLIVFFSLCIGLLVSRTALITLLLIHTIALSYWVFKNKKILLGTLALGSISITFIVLMMVSNTFKDRIVGAFDFSSTHETSASNTRFTLWKLNFEIAQHHLLFGVGEGDVRAHQEKAYFEANNTALKNHFLNAHNQFLQTLVGTGILGLLSLLFVFLTVFKKLWSSKLIIGSFFVLLIFINFVTEAMLETQSGVIFIAFFTGLFWAVTYQLSPKQQTEVSTESNTALP